MMFTANMTYQKTISMITEICCNCGIAFGVPSDFKERCQNDPEKYFYCPNGHSQHYSKSAEVIKRERIEQQLRDKETELNRVQFDKIQLESQLNKSNRQLKRLHNGVCPCCNRSFVNLQQHMKKQHPDAIIK